MAIGIKDERGELESTIVKELINLSITSNHSGTDNMGDRSIRKALQTSKRIEWTVRTSDGRPLPYLSVATIERQESMCLI